jgi:hypothetical protein
MQYSTLQEAYGDTSDKSKIQRKTGAKSSTKASEGAQINQQQQQQQQQQGPANIETSKLSTSSEKIDLSSYEKAKTNNGGTCSPIQAPMYSIPVTGDCKKEKDDAMKVYIEENFKAGNSIEMTNRSHDNVMPYYDEDMEQYFDINNLIDEVKYNANNNPQLYMPNSNKKSYVNDNTGEYSNNTSVFTNGNNLLNNSEYNLSEEERKNASEALAYLKNLESKVNANDGSSRNSISDQIKESNMTGPGGYRNIAKENQEEKSAKEIEEKARRDKEDKEREEKLQESIRENKKFENTINTIINVFIFIFIGGAIILLCDYIVEMAIHIGMKKTTNILEPYINNNNNLNQNYNQNHYSNYNSQHGAQNGFQHSAQHSAQHYSQFPSHYRHFLPGPAGPVTVPGYQNAATGGNLANIGNAGNAGNVGNAGNAGNMDIASQNM